MLNNKAGFVVRLCFPVPHHPWQTPGCRPGGLARMWMRVPLHYRPGCERLHGIHVHARAAALQKEYLA